jgi:hypothetical protein
MEACCSRRFCHLMRLSNQANPHINQAITSARVPPTAKLCSLAAGHNGPCQPSVTSGDHGGTIPMWATGDACCLHRQCHYKRQHQSVGHNLIVDSVQYKACSDGSHNHKLSGGCTLMPAKATFEGCCTGVICHVRKKRRMHVSTLYVGNCRILRTPTT